MSYRVSRILRTKDAPASINISIYPAPGLDEATIGRAVAATIERQLRSPERGSTILEGLI